MSIHRRSLSIRVVVMPSEGLWLAQGLEYDLAAQGRSHEQAVESFTRILKARLRADIARHREPLEDLPEAPERFFQLWERMESETGEDGELSSVRDGDIPPAFVISHVARNNSGSDLSN